MPHNPTMSHNRFHAFLVCLCCLPILAIAQQPSQVPVTAAPAPNLADTSKKAEEPPTEAEIALDEAISKVKATNSLAADLAIQADMLNERFEIEGQYLKAPDYRVSLRLNVRNLGDATGTMIQVCDGETLWDYQQIIDAQRVSRLSLAPILKIIAKPEVDAEFRDQIISNLGFAGPDSLLAGLRKACKFDQKIPRTVQGLPELWELRGTWKDTTSLGPQVAAGVAAGNPFPAFVPSVISLWIGQADGFPYKLTMEGKLPSILQRRDDRLYGPDGRPIGRRPEIKGERPTRIALTYSNVQINPELAPQRFAFEPPPGVPLDDQTDRLASQLEQAVADRAAMKRSEANRTSGPVLEGVSLPAPTPLDAQAPNPPAPIPVSPNPATPAPDPGSGTSQVNPPR
jgi:outer membrane lipoprotein-sorting protein